MSFFKENDDRIDITEKEVELMELLDNVGVNYRRVVEPVKISITTEKTTVPATELEQFYLEEEAQDKEVDEGTILINEKKVISEEYFSEFYEPYVDENGNVIEGMYIKILPATIIKNPYDKPIVKTNPNGWIISEGDADCYLVFDEMSDIYGFSIMTKEKVEKNYIPYELKQEKKNSFY